LKTDISIYLLKSNLKIFMDENNLNEWVKRKVTDKTDLNNNLAF